MSPSPRSRPIPRIIRVPCRICSGPALWFLVRRSIQSMICARLDPSSPPAISSVNRRGYEDASFWAQEVPLLVLPAERAVIPITSPEGRHLRQDEPGFLEVYARIHTTFGTESVEHTAIGTLAHLIDVYRGSPEFKGLKPKTRRDYGRYLDVLRAQHGHRSIAKLPREAIFKLRDEFQATPRTANYLVSVLRLLLGYAEDRK